VLTGLARFKRDWLMAIIVARTLKQRVIRRHWTVLLRRANQLKT
jgi:hypothetical protein